MLILKIFGNLLCNIFIDVNTVQNICTLRCNLIFVTICPKGPNSFFYASKNVMHFFIPNPYVSTCVYLILCLSIFVVCILHLVNFFLTLFGFTFQNHKQNFIKLVNYRNHSFGLATKARACKGAGQEGSLGVTSHALESGRKVWRNEPSHSQVSSHFGSWSLDGLSNL